MRILILLAGSCVINLLHAQKVIDVNAAAVNGISQNSFYTAGGVPFVNAKFVNLVEGTPYLTDNWMKGVVMDRNRQKFSGSMIKLDLLNNELHFMDKNGSEYVSSIDAKEIWLKDSLGNTSYHFINSSAFTTTGKEKKWYQLLDSGKVRLFKTYQKMLSESLPYGGSTHEQRIRTVEQYYIETNSSLLPVKKLKDLPGQLPDKKKETENFISNQNNHDASAEKNWIEAVRYYNAISENR